ncbi:MAG: dihydroorotate dehydrogenase electron transfer subunit [Kiritimatiellae bacterium]|nr:dihydroorotate dehydrogenase electron transfer subunit [Kiritimatiellia bacterium]MDD5521345.1 dihydroorotate dehydrogenase electron transfer subunit [Kiritimatiellia bacterium]
MRIYKARVLANKHVSGDYRVLEFDVPGLGNIVRPGQFIHLRVPRLDGAVLRRPFSVYKSDRRKLSILYKSVGKGTHAMKSIIKGDVINLMGPLGNGFPVINSGMIPVLVAGGYGVAPLAFLASRTKTKGMVFIGGSTASDILCVKDFKSLGWGVRIATEDGSVGRKGLVTKVLDEWLVKMEPGQTFELFACGPDGMLKAVGERATCLNVKAWLSLDKHMGCGVGACLACVQAIRRHGIVSLMRVCREGPVFDASEIVWE